MSWSTKAALVEKSASLIFSKVLRCSSVAIFWTIRRALSGVTTITFLDDTFNVPKRRFKDILRMMIRNRYDFDAGRLAGRNLTRSEWDQYIGDLAPYRRTCPEDADA